MLDRNRRIKKFPERFQECKEQFDIIVTVEERVYDQVLEHMESRDPIYNKPVHVFNVDIEDNHEEALMGAFLITDMINMVMIILMITIIIMIKLVKITDFFSGLYLSINLFQSFLCFFFIHLKKNIHIFLQKNRFMLFMRIHECNAYVHSIISQIGIT